LNESLHSFFHTLTVYSDQAPKRTQKHQK